MQENFMFGSRFRFCSDGVVIPHKFLYVQLQNGTFTYTLEKLPFSGVVSHNVSQIVSQNVSRILFLFHFPLRHVQPLFLARINMYVFLVAF